MPRLCRQTLQQQACTAPRVGTLRTCLMPNLKTLVVLLSARQRLLSIALASLAHLLPHVAACRPSGYEAEEFSNVRQGVYLREELFTHLEDIGSRWLLRCRHRMRARLPWLCNTLIHSAQFVLRTGVLDSLRHAPEPCILHPFWLGNRCNLSL